MDRDSLLRLEKPALVDLVLLLAEQNRILTLQNEALKAQVARLEERIAQLEARLKIPPKTPNNSSLPPSKGQKSDRAERPKKPRVMTKTCLRHAAGPALRASSAPTLTRCSTSMRRLVPAAGPR